ncbi:hypothetical protein ACQKP0_13220 [Heyndrickxia sp. NPDC080065]|uniref:hypothetical protein n=1 Tax=Heyndrickxia sp. NPDC080065 TaxID=3390568 RepID=UPI003D04F793
MEKYKKISTFSLLLVLLLISIGGCINTPDPQITINVQVSKLTEEEMNDVEVRGLNNPKKDDFRKFTLNLNMANFSKISSRKISIPKNMGRLINYIDGDRYWYGNESKRDNVENNFASYTKEFVFYSKGLSEGDIKKAYQSAIIIVTWVTKEGKEIKKEFVVGDLIKFN